MARELREWVGATDDSPVPPRVRLRVLMRDNWTCKCGCGTPITSGTVWQTDHKIAIINGGSNSESNLQSIISAHHIEKTRADVAEKSAIYKKQLRHAGIKKPSSFKGWRNFRGEIVLAKPR